MRFVEPGMKRLHGSSVTDQAEDLLSLARKTGPLRHASNYAKLPECANLAHSGLLSKFKLK